MQSSRAAAPQRVASQRSMFVAAASMGLVVTVSASDAPAKTSGSLALLSDSVYRGLSQTQGSPALHAGAYHELGNQWSLGVALSTIDLGTWVDASATATWAAHALREAGLRTGSWKSLACDACGLAQASQLSKRCTPNALPDG